MFVSSDSSTSDSDSDSQVAMDGCGSPRVQRRKRLRRRLQERMERRDSSLSVRPIDEMMYDDNLPEVRMAALVKECSVLARNVKHTCPVVVLRDCIRLGIRLSIPTVLCHILSQGTALD